MNVLQPLLRVIILLLTQFILPWSNEGSVAESSAFVLTTLGPTPRQSHFIYRPRASHLTPRRRFRRSDTGLNLQINVDYNSPFDCDKTIAGDDSLEFNAPCVPFNHLVEIRDCIIFALELHATYFEGGFHLINCTVHCRVDWFAGGHNNKPILIQDCTFKEFVDVGDCWFHDVVRLERVQFEKGTNLLGDRGSPYQVDFDTEPQIIGVEGILTESSNFTITGPIWRVQ